MYINPTNVPMAMIDRARLGRTNLKYEFTNVRVTKTITAAPTSRFLS
jgi:hypothetical protein